MKTIIAGSRQFISTAVVEAAVAACGFPITHVVSGAARGVDQAGEAWATAQGLPITRCPADWDRFGKSAGYRRNEAMANLPGVAALVLAWDSKSPGSAHMCDIATRRGLRVSIYRPQDHPGVWAAELAARAVAARTAYNDLHTAVWRAHAAWAKAVLDPTRRDTSAEGQALARAQMALDRARPGTVAAVQAAAQYAALVADEAQAHAACDAIMGDPASANGAEHEALVAWSKAQVALAAYGAPPVAPVRARAA